MSDEWDDAALAAELGLLGGAPKPTQNSESASLAAFSELAFDDLAPRARFDALVTTRSALVNHGKQFETDAKERYRGRVQVVWQQTRKSGVRRARFDLAKAETELAGVLTEVKALAKAEWAAYYQGYQRAMDRFDALVRATANDVVIAPTETKAYFTTTDQITYNSQPAAGAYAKKRSDLYRFELHHHGLRSEVKPHVTGGLWTVDVFVYCAEADVPVLREKSGPLLKDMVRACWGLGINPRVLWPMLEHGFEEAHGLDFFGGFVGDPHSAGLPEPMRSEQKPFVPPASELTAEEYVTAHSDPGGFGFAPIEPPPFELKPYAESRKDVFPDEDEPC